MTVRQQKAIAAMISAPTLEQAARDARIGTSTLRRWLKEDPAFIRAYNDALTELLTDATAKAKRNVSCALDVLVDVMQNGESSQVRVTAARSTIEYALKLHDAAEMTQRLQALEKRIEEIEDLEICETQSTH